MKVKDQDPKELVNLFKVDRKAQVVVGEAPPGLAGEQFVPLLNRSEYPHREGRGVYCPTHIPGRHLYVKGSGNEASLESATQWDDRKYKGFGSADPDLYLMEPVSGNLREMQTGPRVRGALTLTHALREYHLCDIFLKTYAAKNGFSLPEINGVTDFSAARARGLSIPVAVISAPGVSKEINRSLVHIINDPNLTGGDFHFRYGMVALEVPAHERVRRHENPPDYTTFDFYMDTLSSREMMEMVGRVLKHQLQCGFVTQSLHYQNIYRAPHSECPQADHADLVPISDVIALYTGKEDIVHALIMHQLELVPHKLLRFHESEFGNPKEYSDLRRHTKAAIHTILDVICPGAWDTRELEKKLDEYREKPYSLVSYLSDTIRKHLVVETAAPKGWQALQEKYREYSFGELSRTIGQIALDKALHTQDGLKAKELNGGFKPRKTS